MVGNQVTDLQNQIKILQDRIVQLTINKLDDVVAYPPDGKEPEYFEIKKGNENGQEENKEISQESQ
jgi:hypothetical protein